MSLRLRSMFMIYALTEPSYVNTYASIACVKRAADLGQMLVPLKYLVKHVSFICRLFSHIKNPHKTQRKSPICDFHLKNHASAPRLVKVISCGRKVLHELNKGYLCARNIICKEETHPRNMIPKFTRRYAPIFLAE